ncbi:MAG: DNA primase [Gaiellales bacterium]|nr:DNA primase [Gaiellales bacterium]
MQAVAAAADLADVVSRYTSLRKRGSTLLGLCPFHQEKTPSFTVSVEKGLYHCFGCGEGGDVFTFLQRMDNLTFTEAVEVLAERYSVPLEREEMGSAASADRGREQRLLQVLEKAAAFYQRYLWESKGGEAARAYLAARGLGRTVCEEFLVGLAPTGWHVLSRRAGEQGFTARELEAAGLTSRSAGRVFDRFRGRLMFPLVDHRGRVVGFGGRMLGDDLPKYLNSPEGPVYDKGRLLYGLFQARRAIVEADEVIVVEGYTDVLGMVQAGVTNVVASMGTAFTGRQLALLTRFTKNVTFMFDADRAGAEAAVRSGEIARQAGLRPMVVALPPGRDPAELAVSGSPDDLRRLVAGKISLLRYEINGRLGSTDLTGSEGRVRAFEAVRKLLDRAGSPQEKEEEVQFVADRLRLAPENVRFLLRTGATRHSPTEGDKGEEAAYRVKVLAPEVSLERRFLAGVLRHPGRAAELFRGMSREHFVDGLHQRVYDVLCPAADEGVPVVDAARRATLEHDEVGRLLTGLLISSEDDVHTEGLLQHDYLKLQEQHLDRVIGSLQAALTGDPGERELEGKLLRLEVLRQEVRHMLANVDEE